MCPQVTFSVWISELFFSRAKHTSFHFHWQLQTEANFWNTGIHLKFHFHFSEIIQMSSVYTEPSQQSELFSILLWRGSWFWLFTHFGAIKSPRLRLGLFIAPKCVKSQNQLPFHTMKRILNSCLTQNIVCQKILKICVLQNIFCKKNIEKLSHPKYCL